MSKNRPRPARASATAWRRRLHLSDRQILLVVVGINLLVSLAVFEPTLAPAGDNAQYVILAKSILGGGYQDLHQPGAPPHSQFPPVLPLLLVPVLAVFGMNFVLLKLPVLACSLAGVAAFYLLLKRITSRRDWILPLLLFAFCPLYLQYSHDVFSEVPFILFSLLTLSFLHRGGSDRKRELWYAGATGLFAALTFLTRTQGLTLPVGIAVYLLLRRRWRFLAIFALVFAIVWLPWLMRDLRVPHIGGYREQLFRKDEYNVSAGYVTFRDMAKRVVSNLGTYLFKVVPAMLVPVLAKAGKGVLGACGVLLAALGVAGIVTRIRQHGLGPLELYLALTLGVVLFWPTVWAGDRFLLPVLPIIVLYLVSGLGWLGRRLKARIFSTLAGALLLLLFGIVNAGNAQTAIRDVSSYVKGDHLAGYDEGWRTYFQACYWFRDHVDSSAVVVSRKPQFTYLFSGRKSFVFPFSPDENKVLKAVDSLGATHVFLETFFAQSTSFLYSVIRDHADRFEQIGSVGSRDLKVFVFRVKR